MKSYSFYDRRSGLFIGKTRTVPDSRRVDEIVVPDGCGMVEGTIDHLSKRVDLVSGLVVDYQPPQPDADHEWNKSSRRWEKRAAVVAREYRRKTGLARIAELESKQARIEREIRLRPEEVGTDGKTPLLRLEELDAEIARVRGTLNGETETTSP